MRGGKNATSRPRDRDPQDDGFTTMITDRGDVEVEEEVTLSVDLRGHDVVCGSHIAAQHEVIDRLRDGGDELRSVRGREAGCHRETIVPPSRWVYTAQEIEEIFLQRRSPPQAHPRRTTAA